MAPLVLIVEDLHCAADPTLRLLEHVARYRQQSQLMIVGTYRSAELTRASALWRSFPDLRNEGVADVVKLSGLGHAEVTTLIEVWAGGEVAPDLSHLVQSRTEGNPFFIGEVLRGVSPEVATGDQRDAQVRWEAIEQAGIPEGVKEVIGRRLDQLAEPVVRALSIASVIGRRFSLELLEWVSDHSGDELADWLEQAVEAQVAIEVPGAIGLYNFSHTLIAETLYEDLTATRRARLHRQIGEAIEAIGGNDLRPHLPALAHHFLGAGPAAGASKAVVYLSAAGEQALEQLAYEQAATQFERALEALERWGGEPRERCDVLLLAGRANVMSGNPERAKAALVEAAEIARDLDDPESLARAAFIYARPYPEAGIANETTLALLEEALASLGPVDSSHRALALARLAMELHWSERVERRFELSREAIEVARRIGDDHALGTALHCRHYAISGPDTVEERLAIATEMIAVAERTATRNSHSGAITSTSPIRSSLGTATPSSGAYARRELSQQSSLPLLRLGLDVPTFDVGAAEREARGVRAARDRGGGGRAGRRDRRGGPQLRRPDLQRPARAGPHGRARAGRSELRRRAG